MICLLQSFFVKHSNKFFSVKITNNICLWHSVFHFLIRKTSDLQCFILHQPAPILIVLWYVLFYLFNMSSNLPIYTFFDIEIVYLKILLFNFLIILSAATGFLSLCVSFFRYVFISILLFCKIYFLDLL